MNANVDVAETLALVKAAYHQPEDMNKAWNQASSAISGITAYDLEAPAKMVFPVLTPLRNQIPRVSGRGGIQANWRAVWGINTTSVPLGVTQGNRGGVMTTITADHLAAYKGLGLEDFVTFEANYSAEGFQDVKSLAALDLLHAVMIGEEQVILGGNSSLALGTTATPTVVGSATGGSLTGTTSVIVVALTMAAYQRATVAGGIPQQISRASSGPYANTDTINGGAARKSAAASASTGAGAGSATATVTALKGAYAYAWYWGTGGSEALGAITTINSVSILANATGTQLASALAAADYSQDSTVFDGLLTLCNATPPTNAAAGYYSAQATGTAGTGTPLTSGSDGTITEIDTALQWFWDNYRLSPDLMLVSSQEMKNIRKKALTGSTTSAQRFIFDTNQQGMIIGTGVRAYSNPFTMAGNQEIEIQLHPNMPAGTVLFLTRKLPYPLSNVQNVMQIRTRQEYYQLEWPVITRKYEYGVYTDEVLQHFFPPSLGMITNVGNG